MAIMLLVSCRGFRPAGREELRRSSYMAGVSVHDPSIIKAGGQYYIFGSHMEAAASKDLIKWKRIASGVTKANPLFDNLFTDMRAFDYVGRNEQGGYSVWAPDVIYNRKTGKYMMYFCTTSTYIKSNICFALSDSAEGPYHYVDRILYSGFTGRTLGETDVEGIVGKGQTGKYYPSGGYLNTRWPNAIDPALFYDKRGRLWMTYGSWSGGIFLLEIDQETGYPIHPENNEETRTDAYFGRHLAGGWHNSVEGPYIIYDEQSGYYYLFVSYGGLVSNGGYQIRLYRSETPEGPYVDKKGEELDPAKPTHYPYGVKMMGNYMFPSLLMPYMAPGHNSALIEGDKIYLVHHTRFDDSSEFHEPRVRRLFRTSDGWLTAAPFSFTGTEKLAAGLSSRNVGGRYFVVNHGTDIGPAIHGAEETLFKAGGVIVDREGKHLGRWQYEKESASFTVTLGSEIFTGVLLEQKDEAGDDVTAFSLASEGNETLWGVRYE